VKKGLRALNRSVFLDADRQPSPSGRQKSHDFKHCRPDLSVHGFVLALRRARSLPGNQPHARLFGLSMISPNRPLDPAFRTKVGDRFISQFRIRVSTQLAACEWASTNHNILLRFHLVMDTIDRLPQTGDTRTALKNPHFGGSYQIRSLWLSMCVRNSLSAS